MNLTLFLLATFALNITPGPDMLYVMARSLGQGTRAGVVSALGIGVGTFVHMAALAIGLSTLLTKVPAAYDAVKYVGAAYLAYLGLRTILSKGDTLDHTLKVKEQASLRRVFGQGIVTNVLNPKVALFFIAFIPQFTNPDLGPIGWQVLLLGMIFNTSGTAVNSSVAFLAGSLGDKLRLNKRVARVQRWFTGTVFLALATRLVWPDSQS
jgi:threonine/homoserine/homoserine lactone efflux protein